MNDHRIVAGKHPVIRYLAVMDNDADDQTHPVINVEESIGKTVGRRKPGAPYSSKGWDREAMIRLRAEFGGVRIPRGVFRFRTHEEADRWMIQTTARAAARD